MKRLQITLEDSTNSLFSSLLAVAYLKNVYCNNPPFKKSKNIWNLNNKFALDLPPQKNLFFLCVFEIWIQIFDWFEYNFSLKTAKNISISKNKSVRRQKQALIDFAVLVVCGCLNILAIVGCILIKYHLISDNDY